MKPTMLLITLTLLMALGPTRGLAQEPRWQQEIEALKMASRLCRRSCKTSKLVRAAPQWRHPQPPQHVVLTVADGQIKGEPTATVTLVEFTDFQCPFCSKYVHDTFPHLDESTSRPGRSNTCAKTCRSNRFTPMPSKLPKPPAARRNRAKAGRCMPAYLTISTNWHGAFTEHAQAVGIDTTAFQHCVDSGKYAALIRQDMSEAQGAGVTGTPSFFFGRSDPDGQVTATRSLAGAQAYSAFKAAIDALRGAEVREEGPGVAKVRFLAK